MKPRPASIVQRPFADLGQRLAAKQVRLPAVRSPIRRPASHACRGKGIVRRCHGRRGAVE